MFVRNGAVASLPDFRAAVFELVVPFEYTSQKILAAKEEVCRTSLLEQIKEDGI